MVQNATLLLPVIKLDNNKVLAYNNCVYSRWYGNEGKTYRKPEIAGNVRLRMIRFVRPHIWVYSVGDKEVVLSFCGHGCVGYEWNRVETGGWTLKWN